MLMLHFLFQEKKLFLVFLLSLLLFNIEYISHLTRIYLIFIVNN
jgi:hypothetical protein